MSRELPSWMCDAGKCALLSTGRAVVSIAALEELREIVTALLAAASTRSVAESWTEEERQDETKTVAATSSTGKPVRAADRRRTGDRERVENGGRRGARRTVTRGSRSKRSKGGRR